MLDRSMLGTSWDSVMSREWCGARAEEACTPRSSARSSPLKDSSNVEPREEFCVSRHNPNRTFRRESVIASWRSVRRERERALGKRLVYVEAENHEDYYGRSEVKRSRSERTAAADAPPRRQRRVNRTCSILYRYDPSAEKVVKEYKYRGREPPGAEAEAGAESGVGMHKSASEPQLVRRPPQQQQKKRVRRSLTALLSIKTKLLNIFSSKS